MWAARGADTDRAVIDRLDVELHVAPGSEAASARVERLAGERLHDACAEAIARVVERAGEPPESVIRVRHLDVDVLVVLDRRAARGPEAAAAGRWADAIAAALAAVLAESSPARVRRFANAAEYLAAFLAERADGGAERWCYEDLGPVRSLPPARAAADLLGGSPARAEAVLLRLDRDGALSRVLRDATPGDVADLWRALDLPAADPPDVSLAAGPVLDRIARGQTGRTPCAGGPLALEVVVAGLRGGVTGGERAALAHAARAVAGLATAAGALGDANVGPGALLSATPEVRRRLASLPDGRWVAEALDGPHGAAALRRIAAVAAPLLPPAAAPSQGTHVPLPASARHAGVFLLLKPLLRLGIAERLAAYPCAAAPEERVSALLSLLAAASAGPDARTAAGRRDPALPAFGGRSSLPGADVLARLRPGAGVGEWRAALPAVEPELRDEERRHLDVRDGLALDDATADVVCRLAGVLLRALAASLPGFAGSSAGYLARNVLGPAGVLVREDGVLRVRLERTALHVVVRHAGLDGETPPLPWLGGRRVVVEHME